MKLGAFKSRQSSELGLSKRHQPREALRKLTIREGGVSGGWNSAPVPACVGQLRNVYKN